MIGEIQQIINGVIEDGKDFYIFARDAKHSESLRVTAFNVRRRMPEIIAGNVGIQKVIEKEKYFVRIYIRTFNEFERWERDSITGELTPTTLPIEEADFELKKIVGYMKKDGKSQEEIDTYIKEYKESP